MSWVVGAAYFRFLRQRPGRRRPGLFSGLGHVMVLVLAPADPRVRRPRQLLEGSSRIRRPRLRLVDPVGDLAVDAEDAVRDAEVHVIVVHDGVVESGVAESGRRPGGDEEEEPSEFSWVVGAAYFRYLRQRLGRCRLGLFSCIGHVQVLVLAPVDPTRIRSPRRLVPFRARRPWRLGPARVGRPRRRFECPAWVRRPRLPGEAGGHVGVLVLAPADPRVRRP